MTQARCPAPLRETVPHDTPAPAPDVPKWLPPLDASGLADVHGLLVRWAWTAQDTAELLDDVAAALDDVPPSAKHVENLVERHRSHLMKLVNVAVSTRAWQTSAYADALIQRARALRPKETPGDHGDAVQLLRQMAWVAGELLDQLVAHDSIKGAA